MRLHPVKFVIYIFEINVVCCAGIACVQYQGESPHGGEEGGGGGGGRYTDYVGSASARDTNQNIKS